MQIAQTDAGKQHVQENAPLQWRCRRSGGWKATKVSQYSRRPIRLLRRPSLPLPKCDLAPQSARAPDLAHGNLKYDATTAAENGASEHQLMSMFGWGGSEAGIGLHAQGAAEEAHASRHAPDDNTRAEQKSWLSVSPLGKSSWNSHLRGGKNDVVPPVGLEPTLREEPDFERRQTAYPVSSRQYATIR